MSATMATSTPVVAEGRREGKGCWVGTEGRGLSLILQHITLHAQQRVFNRRSLKSYHSLSITITMQASPDYQLSHPLVVVASPHPYQTQTLRI